MKVVLVEDSALIAAELLKRLEQQAIDMVGWAVDEEHAVALIASTQPDAVILDLQLPSGSGLGVLKRMRLAGSKARVLVLSNNDHREIRSACFKSGADGFFDKHTQFDDCLQQLKHPGTTCSASAPA
jgi:DNA-binding NarL/FixJ family response regulator